MASYSLTKHSARLVELAGPAGAGKSATLQALIARSGADNGTIWGLPVLPLLRNGAELIPSFIPLWRQARSPLWEETRHMIRLRTLQRALHGGGSERNTIVFDEGPVFALARLRGFGHPIMRSEDAERWWRTTLQEWAGLIHTVVVLDAADGVLAHRIRSRSADQEVKQASDLEIASWMARFRQALDWVLSRLVLENGTAVCRLDSSSDTPEQLAGRALAALDRSVYAG
jgi:hypothetical protein